MWTQVKLTSTYSGKQINLITWIESKYAQEGKFVYLKDSKEKNEYIVSRVYKTVEYKPNPITAIKEHKKNTGDSIRKNKN